MGSRYHAHAPVPGVDVVDGEPDCDRLRRTQGPVGAVLVPCDPLRVSGELAEVVCRPADDVRSDQIFHVIEY